LPSKEVYTLKAWAIMDKRAWNDVIYLFPNFQEASLVLTDNFSPSKKLLLNFNSYLDKVELITEKGDTIDFPNSAAIKSRTAGKSMPPAGSPALTQAQIDLIGCWITGGTPNN